MLQIGMFIVGIIALVRGRFKLSKNKEVTGGKARLVGLILLAPFPLAFCAGVLLAIASGGNVEPSTALLVDVSLTFGGLITAIVVALAVAKPPQAPAASLRSGFAPPVNAPPADPNNPYASPFGGGDGPRPPPRQ